MTDIELAWLAGLLEGEGCFGYRKRTRKASPTPTIQCGMTDEDVVRRVASLAGFGSVGGPYVYNAYKPLWKWVGTGIKAAALMEILLPHMGERRQAKIREIIYGLEKA